MIKYDFKKNILSFKFMLYIMSICILVFISAYISDGFPDILFFDSYISLQWESILVYMFPVISALFINDIIYNEFESGKTKYILLYVHSKKKLFFYKLFMTIVVSLIMLIAVLISSLTTFMLWHSRVVRFTDLLIAVKVIVKILVYLIPIELVFTYVAYRSTNAISIMLTVYLVSIVIDVLVPQVFFTPTSLLNKNYSYKTINLIMYLLIGSFVNMKYVSRKDYAL